MTPIDEEIIRILDEATHAVHYSRVKVINTIRQQSETIQKQKGHILHLEGELHKLKVKQAYAAVRPVESRFMRLGVSPDPSAYGPMDIIYGSRIWQYWQYGEGRNQYVCAVDPGIRMIIQEHSKCDYGAALMDHGEVVHGITPGRHLTFASAADCIAGIAEHFLANQRALRVLEGCGAAHT